MLPDNTISANLALATPDQAAAFKAFLEWVSDQRNTRDPSRPFILRAGAGNGKSWFLNNILMPYLQNTPKTSVVLTTTTNQACASLDSQLGGKAGIESSTIHSALGLVPMNGVKHRNPKGFENSPYLMRKSPLSFWGNTKHLGVLIVDEAFRLDQWLLKTIDYVFPNAVKVFVGDPFQTPPVGLVQSPIELYSENTAVVSTLTSSPRFAKAGELGSLVNLLRLAVEYKEDDYLNLLPVENTGYITIEGKKELELRIRSYALLTTPTDISELCILTPKRDDAASLMYKAAMYRVNTDAPIMRVGEACEIAYHFYPTNGEAHIDSAVNAKRAFTESITNELYKRTLKALKEIDELKDSSNLLDSIGTPFYIDRESKQLHILLMAKKEVRLGSDVMRKLWAIANKSKYNISLIRPHFIKTVHAAQGITSKEVWVDVSGILEWRDHDMVRRLLYTAISRCSGKLHLVR
ncbi:MAG: AAA family ATPase [Shewanella sp.]